MAKQEYYTLTEIKKCKAKYNLIIGERSNGKTTAVLGEILKVHCESNYEECGFYLRRFQEDLKNAVQLTRNLVSLKWVEKYSHGEYNSIRYYRGEWNLVKIDTKTNEILKVNTNPMMYSGSINENERLKSRAFPNCTIICFDEFLTRGYYLPEEFILFQNVISTIVRERDNLTIYMLGNTVNKYCPYFAEMGLNNVKNQKQDTIDIYEYGKSELKVAVEYCKGIAKKSDVYFAFDNPRLAMITKGSWEIDIYPHLPLKYTKKDKVFSAYLEFNGENFELELILLDDNYFLYIHRKTTEIKEDIYPVYSNKINPKYNYSSNIFKYKNKAEQLITSLITQDKVFYQDNEVGEIIRNFLITQKKGI